MNSKHEVGHLRPLPHALNPVLRSNDLFSSVRLMKTWRLRRRETLSRRACFTSGRTSSKVGKTKGATSGRLLKPFKSLIPFFFFILSTNRLQPGARWRVLCWERLRERWRQWGVHADEHRHHHQWKGDYGLTLEDKVSTGIGWIQAFVVPRGWIPLDPNWSRPCSLRNNSNTFGSCFPCRLSCSLCSF